MIVTIKIAIDNATSLILANPIIILNGMQNGDDIGNNEANPITANKVTGVFADCISSGLLTVEPVNAYNKA